MPINKERKINNLTSLAISASISAISDKGVYTLAATKVGSKSFSSDGTAHIFTRESLEAFAQTWADGIITLNHDVVDEGSIVSAWFDSTDDTVYMDVILGNDDTRVRVDNGEPTGVSIEADLLTEDDDHNILSFNGTGVALIFYPDKPACPQEDGCGILSSKLITSKESIKAIDMMDSSARYDLVGENNIGAFIKLDDVTIWNETGDEDELQAELMRYATWKGPGVFYIYPQSDLKIGDVVTSDIDPIYEIYISIFKEGLTSSIVEESPNGGVNITTKANEDPAAAPVVSPEGAALAKELSATRIDLETQRQRVAELEAGAATKEMTDTISSRDATILKLQSEIDKRDTAVAASLVLEIQAHDKEFVAEGQSVEQIKMMHSSIMRVAASLKASEPVEGDEDEDEGEDLQATSFKAPASGKKKPGLTVGGIVAGQWQSDDGKAPLTAKVPAAGSR